MSALAARGAELHFEDEMCSISFESQEVTRGKRSRKLYVLSFALPSPTTMKRIWPRFPSMIHCYGMPGLAMLRLTV
ncbi:hypothetical protein CCR75_005818 [Bremia lactucae]|uniref:Uncharacterized protein n=1 Tax=Bremia lactucae TaxID=4779 RepID=A0A976FNA7_BRELC|nr:hypothetical protein CCR75_005818 [Bremia lactucae]